MTVVEEHRDDFEHPTRIVREREELVVGDDGARTQVAAEMHRLVTNEHGGTEWRQTGGGVIDG